MIKIYAVHTDDPDQRLGSMLASDAKALLETYTYFTDDPDSPNGKGYQRPATESRFPSIAADLEAHGATPLILSERGRWSSVFRSGSTVVEMSAADFLAHVNQNGGAVHSRGSVLDGQHRWRAALLLLASKGVDVELPFLLYVGLSWPAEVERFNTINTTAKNLPKALVEVNRYTTFDADHASGREKQKQDVREVVMSLETDDDSVWHNQVNMTGGRNVDRPVTFEGLRRSSEATFAGRLSVLPLNKKVEMAKVYWRVVAETWPDAWNNVPQAVEVVNPQTNEPDVEERPAKYRIKDLAGVSALAKLGNQILADAYDEETGQCNVGVVRGRLARARDLSWIKSADNADMSGQAGFAGLSEMYEMLLGRVYGGAV